MSMPRSIVFGFAVLVLLTFPVFAQTKTNNDDEISAKEKIELMRFTKRFVRRMQQTRDVRPLLREFFIRDYGEFWSLTMRSEMDEIKDYKLTKRDFQRSAIVFIN